LIHEVPLRQGHWRLRLGSAVDGKSRRTGWPIPSPVGRGVDGESSTRSRIFHTGLRNHPAPDIRTQPPKGWRLPRSRARSGKSSCG